MELNLYLDQPRDGKEERMAAALEGAEADALDSVGMFAAWLVNKLQAGEHEVCAMSYLQWARVMSYPEFATAAEALRMSAPDCKMSTRQAGLARLWELYLADHHDWIQQEAEKSL